MFLSVDTFDHFPAFFHLQKGNICDLHCLDTQPANVNIRNMRRLFDIISSSTLCYRLRIIFLPALKSLRKKKQDR